MQTAGALEEIDNFQLVMDSIITVENEKWGKLKKSSLQYNDIKHFQTNQKPGNKIFPNEVKTQIIPNEVKIVVLTDRIETFDYNLCYLNTQKLPVSGDNFGRIRMYAYLNGGKALSELVRSKHTFASVNSLFRLLRD